MQNLSQLNTPNSLANVIANKNAQTSNSAEKSNEASSFHQTFMRQIQNKANEATSQAQPAEAGKTGKTTTESLSNKIKNVDSRASAATNKNTSKAQNSSASAANSDKEMSTDEVLDKLLTLSNDDIQSKLLDFDKTEKKPKLSTDDVLSTDEKATDSLLLQPATPSSQPSAEAMLASLQALNPRAGNNSSADADKSGLNMMASNTQSTQNPVINTATESALTPEAVTLTPNSSAEQKADVTAPQGKLDFTAAIAAQLSKVNDADDFAPDNTSAQDASAQAPNLQTAAMQQNTLQQNIINTQNTEAIKLPLGHERWNQAVNQKVVWMATNNQQSATLTLNPPDLGPVQVVINVHHDQTDTTFLSDNKEVRQALEDGMENLREAMKEAGITLGQTNINERQSSPEFQQSNQRSTQNNNYSNNTKADNTEKPIARQTNIRMGNGLVDTFA